MIKMTAAAATILVALLLWSKLKKEDEVLKPIEELKVRITHSTVIPDPTEITSTGDWYYLQ